MADIHWSHCTFSSNKTPVPVWAELKSCMPLTDFAHPHMYECMKCGEHVPKPLWIPHALSCKFQPSQCRVCEEYIDVEILDKHWRTCSHSKRNRESQRLKKEFRAGLCDIETLRKFYRQS